MKNPAETLARPGPYARENEQDGRSPQRDRPSKSVQIIGDSDYSPSFWDTKSSTQARALSSLDTSLPPPMALSGLPPAPNSGNRCLGHPAIFKCSGGVNPPCAKVFASGENACS